MLRFLTLIILLTLYVNSKSFATHIVGGEFELVHRNGYNYQVRLNQYFDHIHGNPGAEDPYLVAYIFRKRDNRYVSHVLLSNISSEFVPYSNPDCKKNNVQLQTRKIIYQSDLLYFSPEVYNDPQGYYIVWERCCRNGVINNIKEPERSGQAFYLEFPPVVKDNKQFINSSPILFPPLSDYAVVNQLYYVGFGGQDPDGDSLVYSLEVPLRGNSSPEEPVTNGYPAPYQMISWEYGFNIANVIPGPEPLNIDINGNIRVIPDKTGLYVFSVKCEEYRNKERIGVVVRDFQLLVVDVEIGHKPEIQAIHPQKQSIYNEVEIIRFAADDLKCFELMVTDKDQNEKITVKAIPVNFSADPGNLFSERQGIIIDENDTLKIEVCLPDCAFKINEPFYVDFIAMDDACSLPLMDTVRIGFIVEPEPNQEPVFIDPVQEIITAEVDLEATFQLPISGRDQDGDWMKISVEPQAFDLASYGMTFQEIFNDAGAIDGIFEFNPDCASIDFSLRSSFTLFFRLEDVNECKATGTDLLKLEINVNFPEENKPEISTDLNELVIVSQPGETIEFNVFGIDKDNDLLNLTGFGDDFYFSEHNMQFENKSGRGSVASTFKWSTECSNLLNKDDYLLHFVLDDRGPCKLSSFDTLSVRIKVLAPENEAPIVSIDDISSPVINVVAGRRMQLNVIGYDSENDSIFLSMEEHPQYESLNYEFEPAKGKGRVSSLFKWTPECTLFSESSNDQVYKFSFIVSDLRCLNSKSDTIKVTINVEELIFNFDEFDPYNVFTPNGDQVNDYFEIENLPPDNCENQFIGVEVYNRWGKIVFYDDNRNFRWDGKGFGTGVYYYVLKYSNIDYKGTISILF